MDRRPLPDSVRVLIVDDDHDDFLLTKHIFDKIPNSTFTLDWVDSFDAAKAAIERSEHDVYLIDYHLGPETGLELLKQVKPSGRIQPFILLTGAGNETVESRSLELAASDYLVKGQFDANLLSRTLIYALQRKRVEEQRVEQLLELSRSKDEFISIASHQLRTPATGVKQFVGMLLEGLAGDLSEQQRSLLEKAYESNERQLKIVSDLLKVAQVDAGKVNLRKTTVQVDAFVGAIVREQRPILADRGQTISVKPESLPVDVLLDDGLMRMVLENIIDNASKYSEAGSEVLVQLSEQAKTVKIMVTDDGVGIDPESADRLFQKFSRLDNSLSAKVGGTGLGLYWAQKVVELHGGHISFKQRKPRGTTFTVEVPKGAKL